MRKLSQFEKRFIAAHEILMYSVGVGNPNVIPKIIDNIRKSIIGFRLKTDGENFITRPTSRTVHSLPNSIKTAYEAALYVSEHYWPDFSKVLATIAANDTFVSVCSCHGITDGGFYRKLTPVLLDDNIQEVNGLPLTVGELFSNELKTAKPYPHLEEDELKVSRMPITYSHPETPSTLHRRNIMDSFPIENHKWYNKSTNKLNGLTESLWLSIAIATETMQRVKRPLNIGCLTCVDLRSFVSPQQKSKIDFVGNNFASVSVVLDKIDDKMTLYEAGKQLRNKFNNKVFNGEIFNALKQSTSYGCVDDKNAIVWVSNIGQFNIRKPIEDICLLQNMHSKMCENTVTLSSFSKTGNGKNIITNRFQYSPTALSDEDANKINKAVGYFMRNFPPEMTVGKAIEEIKKLHNK
ncbi:hypothetical protein GPJ56_000085 [Histomonas meleagridis]|uniref:uncharacterized protein n=1 Tax=Histomonas meleagridis TaxID=135588 RepID=UPI00355972E3|nr:hypothetical protein GPJ56_000085 [Histomonas meleagridis]KAH0805584.1 hypothetical protein GO595_001639 [Histomonas meleagridis]